MWRKVGGVLCYLSRVGNGFFYFKKFHCYFINTCNTYTTIQTNNNNSVLILEFYWICLFLVGQSNSIPGSGDKTLAVSLQNECHIHCHAVSLWHHFSFDYYEKKLVVPTPELAYNFLHTMKGGSRNCELQDFPPVSVLMEGGGLTSLESHSGGIPAAKAQFREKV